MSWVVSSVGRVAAVRDDIARQFSRQFTPYHCMEPEETVRQAAATLIDAALAAQNQDFAVSVRADGRQSFEDYSKKESVSTRLNISIEPLYGFLK